MGIEFKKEMIDDRLLIKLSGKLDTASMMSMDQSSVSYEGVRKVIFDFSDVSYISSFGLRGLLSTRKTLDKQGISLVVMDPSQAVLDVFEVTGFNNFINVEFSGSGEITELDHRIYPLRSVQRWMMDTHFHSAKSVMMNAMSLVRLDPSIDMDMLACALNDLVKEHDIFRCRFLFDQQTDDISQRFDGELGVITVEEMSQAEFDSMRGELRAPYQLVGDQLWRARLFKTEQNKYIYLDCYHAIMDGVAMVLVLWRELDRRLKDMLKGKKKEEIKSHPSSYAEYIREEMSIPKDVITEGEEYWMRIYDGFDAKKHIPPSDIEGKIGDEELEFPLTGISKDYFKGKHFSEHAFFLGVSMLAMAKVTGQKKVIMSWVHNGRTTGKEMRLMGIMLEQFPVSFVFDQKITADEFFSQLEMQIKEGMKHRKSLGKVYEVGLEAEGACFILQKGAIGRRGVLSLADTESVIEPLPVNEEVSAAESPMDIELNCYEDGTYSLVLDYNTALYTENAMSDYAKIMQEIIDKIAAETEVADLIS